jgi:hypothetical protein
MAFGENVGISAVQNKCTFVDPENPGEVIVVHSPDKIKVVESKSRLLSHRATCQDASITTEGGPAVYFEGTKLDTSNHCTIGTYGGWAMADYKQKTDKKGTTLTCERN